MAKESNVTLGALKQALELEKKGLTFYQQAAKRTADPKGAAMFRSLADDEVIHQRMIQRQIDALTGGQDWLDFQEIGDIKADLQTPLFPAGRLELEKAIRPDASDTDALLFALKIENDSFDLYAKQAKASQDLNARRMFGFLADAERTHFNLLMLNYESLSSRGGWVD
jgi:rubrerythrin